MSAAHVGKMVGAAIAAIMAMQAAKTPPLKLVDALTAEDSAILDARTYLVQDQSAWAKVWSEHSGYHVVQGNGALGNNFAVADPPRVDFSKNQVIAIFAGIDARASGYNVIGIDNGREDASLLLRMKYLPGGFAHLQTSAFAFVITTRSDRKVGVWLDESAPGSAKPEWHRVAVLLPAKARREE